jgi:hypothetical protein
LIESHGSWSGAPTAYAYQWARCDSSGNGCVSISGATGQSSTVTAADVGHTIRVFEDASDADGVGTTAESAATATAPGIEQVVFVHGLNASRAVAGATDYKALYDAIVRQGRGVYTFCYDHDIAFGDSKAGLAPNRCFSNTSRGESIPAAATVSREETTSPNHIGPLFVSQNKFGVGESNDGDDPLAYDAAKLDDCLAALVRYDVPIYGQALPIAVIGNSMGGAITRGWMQLAKSRNSPALEGVTTVMFIEGATQGSWIAAIGEGVDNSLFVGGLSNDGLLALDQTARTVAAGTFHANPGRAGIQDLAPQSAWYRSIVAAGAPPRLHYFALSADITLDFKEQLLWWNNDLGSTDFIGDGVIELGAPSTTPRGLARLTVVFRDRRGRALLELNTARGPTQGQFTLEIAQHGTFVAALASKLATRRVIHLDTNFSERQGGKRGKQASDRARRGRRSRGPGPDARTALLAGRTRRPSRQRSAQRAYA